MAEIFSGEFAEEMIIDDQPLWGDSLDICLSLLGGTLS